MAKYDVTYECGHEAVVDLFGKNSERENRISYLETILCPECYAGQQAQNNNLVEVEMHYSEYKNDHADCKTKPDSYDKDTKTIIVYLPAAEKEQTNIPSDKLTEIEAIIESMIEEIQVTGTLTADQQKAVDKNFELLALLKTRPSDWWAKNKNRTIPDLISIVYTEQLLGK